MIKIIIFSILFSAITSSAEEIKIEDFAYGHKVHFKEGNSVYQIVAPRNLYKTITQANLADLRVFNAAQESVPHQTLSPDKVFKDRELLPPTSLKYFPIFKEVSIQNNFQGIRVQTNSTGAIVEVSAPDTAKINPEKIVYSYIIDASQLEKNPDFLEFKIGNSENSYFLRKVDLHSSSDLKNWRFVESGAVLAKLKYQGHQLNKNRITLSRKNKYYRLSWKAKESELKILGINAIYRKKRIAEAKDYSWETVTGLADEKDKGVFYYSLPGFFPIEKVQALFTELNTIAKIQIEARNQEEDPWKRISSGTIYSVMVDQTKIEQRSLEFPAIRRRYWRLKIISSLDAFGSEPLTLQFAWAPEKIRFLARGKSPFTLAYGNPTIKLQTGINLKNATWTATLGETTLGPVEEIGGLAKLSYQRPKELPLKKWALWAVLIFGVMAMAKMATTLLKTMKNNKT